VSRLDLVKSATDAVSAQPDGGSPAARRLDVTRAWLHRVMTSFPQATWLTVRYGRHQVVPRVRVAAEHCPGYDAAGAGVRPDRPSPAAADPAAAGAVVAADTGAAGTAGADAAAGSAAARTAGRVPSGTAEDHAAAEVGSADGPPFGLPVLAELPELASALAAFATADDRMLDGILRLSRLLDSG
jgi:hypothetical protein